MTGEYAGPVLILNIRNVLAGEAFSPGRGIQSIQRDEPVIGATGAPTARHRGRIPGVRPQKGNSKTMIDAIAIASSLFKPLRVAWLAALAIVMLAMFLASPPPQPTPNRLTILSPLLLTCRLPPTHRQQGGGRSLSRTTA